jgi:hypothetical protein
VVRSAAAKREAEHQSNADGCGRFCAVATRQAWKAVDNRPERDVDQDVLAVQRFVVEQHP